MNDTNTKIIKVSGKNLDNFFQNLITNDINLLNKQKSIYTCVLSPQGKFLNDCFIVKKNNSFFIEINTSETDEFSNLLSKYDLRKQLDVQLKENLQTFVCLEKDFLPFKDKFFHNSLKKNEIFESFKDPRLENFLIRNWIDKKFITKESILSKDDYNFQIELERIKRLLPNSEIDLEKNRSFIMNFGFAKINAISFNKGCYIGQENTARQKYRGKQKYALKLLKKIEGSFPTFNSELKYLDKKIGVMKSFKGSYGLALIKKDILEEEKDKILEISPMSKFLIN